MTEILKLHLMRERREGGRKGKSAVDESAEMNLIETAVSGRTLPLNVEERLMRLLRLKTVEELNRVLSESPDEAVLESMGPPDELYAEDWKQDQADDAEIEQGKMEIGQEEGTQALFVTKDAEMALLWVPTPPPSELRGFRHFSHLGLSSELWDLDANNVFWSTFVWRGEPWESPIYQEAREYLGSVPVS